MNKLIKKKTIFKISGKRILISDFKLNDIDGNYISWLNDPYVMRFSNQRFTTHTKKTCKVFFNLINNSGDHLFLITLKKSGEKIGTMTVHIFKNHKTADIGILIGKKEFWGQGLGEEAWNLVMNYLLKKKSFRKVTGGSLSCNKGMIKIFKKTGMKIDGVRKSHELLNNKTYNIVHYAKFKNDKKQ